MNKRERILAIAVASLVLGWVLLIWVIDPILASFDQIDTDTTDLRIEVERAQDLIANERELRERWVGYERAGLKRTLEEADGALRIVLLDWADESRLDVGDPALSSRSLREDEDDERFVRITRTFNASGTLGQIDEMLWRVRQSPFPLRIEKCIVEKRRDEGDRLELVLTVSTLVVLEPEAEARPS